MIADFIAQNSPVFMIIIPLLSAFALPFVGRISTLVRDLWVVVTMAVTSAMAGILAYTVYTTGTVIYVFGAAVPYLTIPMDSGGLPVRIIFTVDAFSAFMDIIALIVGFVVILYSIASDRERTHLETYYALFLLMIVGVFGMVSTGDIFNFFVFLEITALSSSALVAYRIDHGRAVEAGIKFALISTIGALFVLISAGIYYAQYDVLNIAAIAGLMRFTILDMIALAFLVAALAMKAGSVPMHFWTPDAYSMAPSSVTAMLVVTSQASLYGLFRVVFTLYNITLNASTVGWIIILLGVASMVVGVTMAIPQKDVKRLMAYHAISQTGYMLLGLGVGLAVLNNPDQLSLYGFTAMEGGIFHIMNHAMYKGLLFLTAGAIIYQVGHQDLNRMGGLGHKMKWTMAFFIIGALAIAGIPPFNGFASKLLIYESVYLFNPALSIIAMVVSILTLASFVKVFHSIFMGP
ncbi:MAG TPA: proton-conducting transporter membrane subunit, partial [Methanomicrobiales archaeon]|nr:proton-conducting transporter membrane subunit [Methanomicrobiales archaeon]